MLILASGSPRRRELLLSAGVKFDVRPADVDESVRPGEDPRAYALRVATDKALAVAGDLVLAADTVVALGDTVLGKPRDVEDARRTLERLSGRTHRVFTAVVLGTRGRLKSRVCSTAVTFRLLTVADIDRYVSTGEPMDKAGAYGIQGLGGSLVDRVRGSYTNVIGLPLRETLALLDRWGGP